MQTRDRQIRRERSRCRRRIERQIEEAKGASDGPKVTQLQAQLRKLEDRWAAGLNASQEARMFTRAGGTTERSPYFAR